MVYLAVYEKKSPKIAISYLVIIKCNSQNVIKIRVTVAENHYVQVEILYIYKHMHIYGYTFIFYFYL